MVAHGLEPAVRPEPAGFDPEVMLLLLALFMLDAFLFPVLLRVWGSFFRRLSRRRDDAGSEPTLSERFVLVLSLPLAFVLQGVALYCACRASAADAVAGELLPVAICSGAVLALYLVQTVAYATLSYAFGHRGDTVALIHAFNVTQSALGFALLLPVVVALFYPQWSMPLLGFAAVSYVAARIVLYISEFKIFYSGIFSLFYFFLYLCTVEIIPPMLAIGVVSAFI